MWHGEFRHPRLVEIYDAQFSWSREDDFFFAPVNQTPSARVADLGCGTTSYALPDESFDVALMTAHVAQFLVNEDDWHGTLGDLHRCLVPGVRLVFDARDPRARLREHWNPRESRRRMTLKDGSGVAVCAEVPSVNDDLISLALHYVFDDGEELVSTANMSATPALPQLHAQSRPSPSMPSPTSSCCWLVADRSKGGVAGC
jgi:hypothetical protein